MIETWTGEQREAISERRHLLLAANAGTGKTSTVVGKILWRLGHSLQDAIDGPVAPCEDPCELGRIAAITFTEKAAQDLRRKLREALAERGAGPGELDRAFVGTIHGFCGEILRQHALRLDIDPSFRVMDARETSLRLGELVRETILDALDDGERDVIELLKDAPLDRYDQYGSSVTDLVRRAMRDLRWHRERYEEWFEDPSSTEPLDRVLDLEHLRSLAPESGSDIPDEGQMDERFLEHSAAVFRLAYRALGRWLTLLERENRRDFDSLVLDVRRLLTHERFAPALDALRERYRLLIVDEFQDTDTAQRDIVFAIGGLDGSAQPVPAEIPSTQLFLVGDPKQSIYGFRGADIRVWNQVEERFEQAGKVRRLGWNFRCDPSLVELVNRSCAPAFEASGTALAGVDVSAVVTYDPLDPAVESWPGAGVDWLAVEDGKSAADRLRNGASIAAGRIHSILRPEAGHMVRESDGRERPVRPDDIAVLALKRKTLAAVERALRDRGVPTYNAASSGLAERQEVLDAVTALRLADNPRDDLRAFAFLRSPFVGLRDEVIARIQLDPHLPSGGLMRRAACWLEVADSEQGAHCEASENEWIEPTERVALQRGLGAIREAQQLVGRAEPADILETILRRTSYRLHLQFRNGCEEALANLERLKNVLGEYRSLSLADFLHMWDRASSDRESDLAAAILPAAADGSVLLTTIHSAKGLEWPIVVLAGAEDGGAKPRFGRWEGWTDRELGPVLLPRSDERGARSKTAEEKRRLEAEAEASRLLYVALTRARDRLMVVARPDEPDGYAGWIAGALASVGAFPAAEADPSESDARGPRPVAGGQSAASDDPGTGTGRQLDAFGLHDPVEDDRGQLNLLNPENHGPDPQQEVRGSDSRVKIPVAVWRSVEPIQQEFAPAPVSLDWLQELDQVPEPSTIAPVARPGVGRLRSATEMAFEKRDPTGWKLQFLHGVLSQSRFAGPESIDPDGPARVKSELPGHVRGSIVHGVLERTRAAPGSGEDGDQIVSEDDPDLLVQELDRLLEETIGGLGEDESFVRAGYQGTDARVQLREEIVRVLSSEAWRGWVAGEHYRELPFVHLAGPGDWRQGRIDLFIPPGASGVPVDSADARIVDFKTDRVRGDLAAAAGRYEIQTRVYREAVEAILGTGESSLSGGGRVRVVLHFTHPNQQIEV